MSLFTIFLALSIVFNIVGLILLTGHGSSSFLISFLIPGYSTKSKTEKAKYDIKALCKFAGKVFILIGILSFLFSFLHGYFLVFGFLLVFSPFVYLPSSMLTQAIDLENRRLTH